MNSSEKEYRVELRTVAVLSDIDVLKRDLVEMNFQPPVCIGNVVGKGEVLIKETLNSGRKVVTYLKVDEV